MNEALKLIFGESIREKEYNFPTGTPNYIRHGYDVVELIWNQKTCLLVKPKNNDWNLATLKKQLKMIEKICGLVAVANLERSLVSLLFPVRGRFLFPAGEAILKQKY